MRHPESDLRHWLGERRWGVDRYTHDRITASFAALDRRLERAELDPDGWAAYDVGCGAGYDTFALATRCDSVEAADVSRRAVMKARSIAWRGGVSHVSFRVADAVTSKPRQDVDLVWCNLMSHGSSSRLGLFNRCVESLRPGGVLFYSEICEGYAPMELQRALETQDGAELISRIRQALNGLRGGGFRWFLSGSASLELSRRGFRILRTERSHWRGLPTTESLVARRTDVVGPPSPPADPDYTDVPERIASAREEIARSRAGQEPSLPLATIVAMARAVDPAMRPAPSHVERIRRRLHMAKRVDWEELGVLNAALLREISAQVGAT